MKTFELWKPLTEEENELAKLCQEFCKICDISTVEQHGKGKLHNIPFNYFMYWDILSNPQDDHCYKQNRNEFEKHLAYVRAHKNEFENEIRTKEIK